jgi:hypothetical protein
MSIPLTEYSPEAILALRPLCHSDGQMWQVEYTDEFGEWFEGLNESEQDSIDRNVHL